MYIAAKGAKLLSWLLPQNGYKWVHEGYTVLIKNYYNYGQPKPVELSHIHHKRELALFQTSSLKPRLGNLICPICWGNFLGLNPKGPHLGQ